MPEEIACNEYYNRNIDDPHLHTTELILGRSHRMQRRLNSGSGFVSRNAEDVGEYA